MVVQLREELVQMDGKMGGGHLQGRSSLTDPVKVREGLLKIGERMTHRSQESCARGSEPARCGF